MLIHLFCPFEGCAPGLLSSKGQNQERKAITMSMIQVTTEQLTSAAVKIESEASSYEQTYRQLLDLVKTMASWQGRDSQAFQNQLAGFEDNLQKTAETAREYAEYLRRSAQEYETAQSTVLSSARGL